MERRSGGVAKPRHRRHRHGAADARELCRGARLARRLSLQRDRKLAHRRERARRPMSMLKRLAVMRGACSSRLPPWRRAPQFGQPIAPADIAPWDISIGPDGAGLPPGRGTAAQGEAVYAAKCQACHGEKGAGGPNDALVGGIGSLAPGKPPVKTVGSYWPYATTLFDYIRRAMPFHGTEIADQRRGLRGVGLHPQSQRDRRRRRGARRAVAAEGENAEPGRVHSVPAQSKVACPAMHDAMKRCRGALPPRHSESPLLMLWTAPPPARECHGCGCC